MAGGFSLWDVFARGGGYRLVGGGIAYLNIPLVFPCPGPAPPGGSSPISIG